MSERAFIRKVVPGTPMIYKIETIDESKTVEITRDQIKGTTWTVGWCGFLEYDKDSNTHTFYADR